MNFKLYSVQEDGSKILLAEYLTLEEARVDADDDSIIYSIEQWDGCFATVLQ